MPKLVVEELRAYLIAQGAAVDMNTPSLTLPSVWLMPRQGTPHPQEKDGAPLEKVTVTLEDTNLQGPPGVEAWLEDCFVAVRTRALNAGEGKLVQRTIKNLLHPIGVRPAGRAHWVMNTLLVQLSATWRGDTSLPASDNGKTYDRIAYYRIQCARSDLA
jgi:hypothetical protein